MLVVLGPRPRLFKAQSPEPAIWCRKAKERYEKARLFSVADDPN